MSPRSFVLALSVLAVACSGGSTANAPPGATPDAAVPTAPYAAGSPWPKFRGDLAQDGASAVHATMNGGALFSFATGKGIFSSPVIGADGTIYVGSADRYFYAINADGSLRWKVMTGEIIDSAALLDDQGRVYFGSGDGQLRALDAATGNVVWTFTADDPSKNNAFLNWFEGNVALGPSGTLYVPNDNFFFYAIDRATGTPTWRFKMPDQTWSLPAIDPSSEMLFVGNNNLLPALGKNTFGINKDGTAQWAAAALGTIAASPLLTPDGKVVVGGFDGYLRAYDESGNSVWSFATRDHLYSSPARLPDGTLVQPGTDGTIYAVDPTSGATKWTYDVREPVRGSPAVDADGNVYVGLGEGRLLVLNKDGTLRWSMQLIDGDRDDLNASPALGRDAIVLAGESGEVFSVPYDYCLRPMGKADVRCAPADPLPGDGAWLVFTTPFGALDSTAPKALDANRAITLTLLVRQNGAQELAILDASMLTVSTNPPSQVDVTVAGDGKFVTLAPNPEWAAAADGTFTVSVSAPTLVNLSRAGLELSGGAAGPTATASLALAVAPKGTDALSGGAPTNPGDPQATWELSRLAVPLPTVMPSYNQIGFDSLHYLLGLVEDGVAWMVGGKLDASNQAVIDPQSKAIFPLSIGKDGGLVTMSTDGGLDVQIMNIDLPFKTFRLATQLGAGGAAPFTTSLTGSTVCAGVPMYGPFLETLGLCNPQTDIISFVGGANLSPWRGGTQQAPAGVGAVTFARTSDAITATVTGSELALADHLASVLVVDAETGKPVTLGYGLSTTRTAAADGTIASVSVPTAMATLPSSARVYLMIDTYPAARGTLTLP